MKTVGSAGSWAQDSEEGERSLWKSTIAAASQALGVATRAQQAVGQSLRLQQKIRALRDELHKAEAERDVYRELHARTVEELHRAIDRSPAEWKRLHSEAESLEIRHRSYKLLMQHYVRAGVAIDAEVFADQRRRVQQHLLFQRRKGVPVSTLTADDIAFLLR